MFPLQMNRMDWILEGIGGFRKLAPLSAQNEDFSVSLTLLFT